MFEREKWHAIGDCVTSHEWHGKAMHSMADQVN